MISPGIPKKRIWRFVLAAAAAAVLVALVVSVILIVSVGRIDYAADEEEPVTIDPAYAAGYGIYFPEGEAKQYPGVINILFLGTDFSFFEGDRGRADSNILCSLNLKKGEIRLVSFERGIGVPIPGRGADLLTHAYQWGGAILSQSIISQMFRVRIDGYAQVNFDSFAEIISTIGGIDVELTELEAKALNGEIPTNTWAWAEMHEGWNHLGGHDTLEYCRLRSIDSDWNRQRRQRTVLEQVQKTVRKMSRAEQIRLVETVLPMIHTNLSRADVLRLIRSMPGLLRGSVSQLQVPDPNGSDGSIRCVPEYEAMKIANFLYDAGYEIKSPY